MLSFSWFTPQVEWGLNLAIVVVLLFLSSLLSAAEKAYFSLDHEDVLWLKEQNVRRARRVLRLLDKPRYLLATLVLANTAMNISLVLVLGGLLAPFLHGWVLLLTQGGAAALLIMFFGELLPKIYASSHKRTVAIFAAVPIRLIHLITLPANFMLAYGSQVIDMRTRQMTATEEGTHPALLPPTPEVQPNAAANAPAATETISPIDIAQYAKQDINILKSYINFSNVIVRTAMRARTDVIGINKEATFQELMSVFKETAYSRLPVYEDDLDHIEGVVYIKDMLAHIDTDGDSWDWRSSLRPILFVPENKKLNQLLSEFQQKRLHFAAVVDEFGHTAGIITLEDILEELVGEIEDESDEPETSLYQQIGERSYLFQASCPLDDAQEILHLPENFFARWQQEVDTLAGVVLIQYGAMPTKGTIVQIEGLCLTVVAANRRRIESIQVDLTA